MILIWLKELKEMLGNMATTQPRSLLKIDPLRELILLVQQLQL